VPTDKGTRSATGRASLRIARPVSETVAVATEEALRAYRSEFAGANPDLTNTTVVTSFTETEAVTWLIEMHVHHNVHMQSRSQDCNTYRPRSRLGELGAAVDRGETPPELRGSYLDPQRDY